MSDLLKIKLTIANRVYPLSVAPEQEASLRASAKKIETTILQLEKNYADPVERERARQKLVDAGKLPARKN